MVKLGGIKLLLAAGMAWALAAPTFEMGLVPNLTARALLTAFEPMRAYLEQQLKQPVRLSTASNFHNFYARTQQDEFDLVITPPHFAWLAIRSARYPLAIVTMRGLEWLREQELQPGTDFSVRAIAPHNAAALAVGRGEFDAAIIGSGPYRIMPEEIRAQIRVFSELGSVPNAIYLASSRLPAERRRELQAHLLAFCNDSAEGRQFMAQYGYGAGKPISAAELKTMDVYARQASQLLDAAQ